MEYSVRRAYGPADHDAIYRGRHAVYVDELGAMTPRPEARISDRFDDRTHTLNLVVEREGTIVGGTRFVVDDGTGTTADAYFDFSPWLPDEAWPGAGSMLWMLPDARGLKGMIPEMMAWGLDWITRLGGTHVLATVNPPAAPGFERVGYRRVGEPFLHGPDQLPVQPMMRLTERATTPLAPERLYTPQTPPVPEFTQPWAIAA